MLTAFSSTHPVRGTGEVIGIPPAEWLGNVVISTEPDVSWQSGMPADVADGESALLIRLVCCAVPSDGRVVLELDPGSFPVRHGTHQEWQAWEPWNSGISWSCGGCASTSHMSSDDT
jgi:hypothetical protein